MGCSELKDARSYSLDVADFVTVKPIVKGGETSDFKIWKKQMICLLQGQDMMGFVDGEFLQPENSDDIDKQKLWRRTDGLVQGWILGSIGKDALDAVWEKPTAREIWLELENIFKEGEEKTEIEDQETKAESSGDYGKYLAVYEAALVGDWDSAETFFQQDINEISTAIISENSETALHLAVLTGKKSNNDFVKKLVEIMPRDALAIKDCFGCTALHNAAIVGNTAAAFCLIKKNPDLLYISSNENRLAIHNAVISCQKETLEYLISEHETNTEEEHSPFQGQLGIRLLTYTISSEFLDIALDLAHKYPHLALLEVDEDGASALSSVAENGTLFPETQTFRWWQTFIYNCIPLKISKCEAVVTSVNSSNTGTVSKNFSTSFTFISTAGQKLKSMIWYIIENLVPKVKELKEMKTRRLQALQLAEYLCNALVSLPGFDTTTIFWKSMSLATDNGISEIVEMIIDKYPPITFDRFSDTGMNIFQQAASYRFENVINLLYNMNDSKYLIFDTTDDEKNNILHICARLAPPNRINLVAGAALQMQRELQWFKEIEKLVHPSRRTWTNNDLQTPQMIFTKEHEKLKADGERWMKDTANACSITAALIATVVFAAAFTVPGGIESATGMPSQSGEPSFLLFAVSNAISLFTSIASLLMFLSILTSRYAEEDFLYVLPKRLSIGLLSLFVSITFMMIAFSATLYLVFRREVAWFLVLLAGFACFPITSFILLQFPLLVDVAYSTYGPGIFGKKADRILY